MLAGVGGRFLSFVNNYTEHFQSYRHDVSDKARQYASGLMQAGSRKNMDRMAEVVPESKSRNLQQFLTHSRWKHREVIDHVITRLIKAAANLIPSRRKVEHPVPVEVKRVGAVFSPQLKEILDAWVVVKRLWVESPNVHPALKRLR